MPRTGPVTKDTTTVALGYAQIRIGDSADNINRIHPVLSSDDSIGALANTKFTSTIDNFKLESGFPLLEDAIFPLRETAMMDCAFKEITPANMALARGLDPANYTQTHSGSIALGTIAAPVSVRMEAVYTYPDGVNTLTIIFPRAQVEANIEMDFAEEEPAAVAVTIGGKRADSEISGGNAVWDSMPLGRLIWGTTSSTYTTTTSSTTTTTTP